MFSIRNSVVYGSLCAALCTIHSPVFAGKPTPAPPIYYHIQYFTGPGGSSPAIRAMNNSGVMVGDYYHNGVTRGFLYDPAIAPNEAIDLNDVVDLTGVVAVPTDWVISYAVDVNDRGALLATIEKVAQRDVTQPDFERHGVVIDRRQIPWTTMLLPDAASHVSMGIHINNNGDVLGGFVLPGDNIYGSAGAYLYNVGLYRETGPDPTLIILPVTLRQRSHANLNDPVPGYPLRVVGVDPNGNVFRYTVGDETPLEVFTLDINADKPGINGYGVFCSRARVRKTKGSQYVWRPFWFDPDLYSSPTFIGSETTQAGQIASDINDHGDVILNDYLYRNGTLLAFDNLVSGAYGDYWRTHRAGVQYGTQRTANGYPLLSGGVSNETGGHWGVLLTPQTTPQP